MVARGRQIDSPADIVVAGFGVQPVTDLLANSGIELADGVMVNEYLETSAPGIFAAGDIANYQDVLFQKRTTRGTLG